MCLWEFVASFTRTGSILEIDYRRHCWCPNYIPSALSFFLHAGPTSTCPTCLCWSEAFSDHQNLLCWLTQLSQMCWGIPLPTRGRTLTQWLMGLVPTCPLWENSQVYFPTESHTLLLYSPITLTCLVTHPYWLLPFCHLAQRFPYLRFPLHR